MVNGVPTTPTETEQWKSFYGGMNTDEKAYFDALPQEQKNKYAEQIAQGKAQEAQDLLNKYRYTRDISRQAEKVQSDYDYQLSTYKAQFAQQADAAKKNVDNVTRNMYMARGMAGSAQIEGINNVTKQEIDRAVNNYNSLISSQDNFLKKMADDLKYNKDTLTNEFNDNISKAQAEMLSKINAINKTGEMDTALGMQKARSFLDQMLSDQVNSTQNYYGRVKALNDLYETSKTNAVKYSSPSVEMSQMMNQGKSTGTLYNALGQPIMGIDNQPITYNISKEIQNVSKEQDGSTTIFYKDGTYENKKLGGEIAQSTLESYARAIESGAMQINQLPQGLQNQVIGMIDWTKAPQTKGTSDWEYKEIEQKDPDTGETIKVPIWVNNRTQEVKPAMP